jgi:hypothetical protein
VDVLLVSPDPASRELMALAVRSIERRVGSPLRFRAAKNGELGIRAALRDDNEPFTGVIVILLERKHDAWLARWSGADAWFVRPVDPFALADRVLELVTEKESA